MCVLTFSSSLPGSPTVVSQNVSKSTEQTRPQPGIRNCIHIQCSIHNQATLIEKLLNFEMCPPILTPCFVSQIHIRS